MLHVRVVTPADELTGLVQDLELHGAVCNIVVMVGAARKPDGDVIEFDVAREAANGVISSLRARGLHRVGSITVERIDMSMSEAAAAAEAHAPGDPSDAVVWEEVEARVRADGGWSVSFNALLVIAAMIGAIGVLVDSPILIVGARVVGPEFGPIASIAFGLHTRRLARVRRGVLALAVGLPTAIAAAAMLTWLLRLLDRVPLAYLAGERPLTNFISSPDLFAVIVAVLAGVAGALSLTEARHGALVGVLISVTTIPAAANIGVALAMSRSGEAAGAFAQLSLNLVILAVAGAATLRLQAIAFGRLTRPNQLFESSRLTSPTCVRSEGARKC